MPHPHPHKHNTFNMCKPDTTATESDYDTEELYTACEELDIPRHFTNGLFEFQFHKHYFNTTDNEQSHLNTSSEDEHSLIWTMKSPQCLHIQSLWPQFHFQDLQGHAHYQHHNPQRTKTRSQVAEKPAQDSIRHHIKHLHNPKPGKHHCYPHTPCQLNNRQKEHSFQDCHNTVATDTSTILTFQDLADNKHCYYPVHQRDQTSFKDISIHKYHFTCQC